MFLQPLTIRDMTCDVKYYLVNRKHLSSLSLRCQDFAGWSKDGTMLFAFRQPKHINFPHATLPSHPTSARHPPCTLSHAGYRTNTHNQPLEPTIEMLATVDVAVYPWRCQTCADLGYPYYVPR
ncbi:hypothetical protein KCU91_g49, partial [Aureobasidium melanogenum]